MCRKAGGEESWGVQCWGRAVTAEQPRAVGWKGKTGMYQDPAFSCLPGRPCQATSLESHEQVQLPLAPQRSSRDLFQPRLPFGMSWRSCQLFCEDETCSPLVLGGCILNLHCVRGMKHFPLSSGVSPAALLEGKSREQGMRGFGLQGPFQAQPFHNSTIPLEGTEFPKAP